MPTVRTTDGRKLLFPDGMSREDMAAALSQLPPPPSVADTARERLTSQGLTPDQVKAGQGLTRPEDIKFDDPSGPGVLSGVADSFSWLAHPIDTVTDTLDSADKGMTDLGMMALSPILRATGRLDAKDAPSAGQIADAAAHATVLPGAVLDTAREATRRGAANESTKDMVGNALGMAGQAAIGKFVVPKVAGFVTEKAPGAFAAVKEAPGAIRTALGETAPRKIMNALAKPDLKSFNFGAEPGKGAAGITANSLEGLQTKVNAKISDLHAKLMDRLAPAQRPTIDAQAAIAGPVQRAIDAARRTGNTGTVTRLKQLGEAQLAEAGKRMLTPTEAQAMKMQLKDLVRWTQDPTEGSVNAALQDMYREFDKQIDAVVPAAAPLNKQMANLITYEKAIDKRINLDLKTHPAHILNPLNAAMSTPVQSRLAAGLKGAFGRAEPSIPETPPSAPYQPPPGQPLLGPGRDQLALPPSPDGSAGQPVITSGRTLQGVDGPITLSPPGGDFGPQWGKRAPQRLPAHVIEQFVADYIRQQQGH